ncbi:MAG: hypothetical protein ABL927_03885 [Bdellovibrionales bacterium]
MSTVQNIFLSSFCIFFITTSSLINIAQAMTIPLPAADSKLYIEQNADSKSIVAQYADNVPIIAQYKTNEDLENNFTYSLNTQSPTKTNCTNDTSICSRYCRVSESLNCPKTNYLMNFGYKYCRIFLENENLFTNSGKLVFQNIRSCLIQTLTENLTEKRNLTCANVKSVASRSHRTCYLKNGFCELSAWDKFIVYWYAMPELTDPLFRKTKDQITRACFKR